MKHRVIVIQPIHDEGMKILHARDDLEVIVPANPDPATWSNFLPGTEALCVRLSKIPRSLIEAAPDLKIISRHGVGCDNIDVEAATEHGVVVATVGLANAPSVVEHTLSLMLALAKRLFDVDRDVRGGDYMRKLKLEAQDIGGRTVLIVGLGRIGSRLAKTLNALGMKCLGVDPAYTPAQIEAMGCEPVDGLPLGPAARRFRHRAHAAAGRHAQHDRRARAFHDEADRLPHQLRARRHRRREGAAAGAGRRGRSWARASTCRSTSRPSPTIRCSSATG